MCERNKTSDSQFKPPSICHRIDLLSNNGKIGIEITGDGFPNNDGFNITIPFHGPPFQVARIWVCLAIGLKIFGGLIIWITFIADEA